MAANLDHLRYDRLPWNYAHNGTSWLDLTARRNLRRQGCYREANGPGRKTLEPLRAEPKGFKILRRSGCRSIAGGDPPAGHSPNRPPKGLSVPTPSPE